MSCCPLFYNSMCCVRVPWPQSLSYVFRHSGVKVPFFSLFCVLPLKEWRVESGVEQQHKWREHHRSAVTAEKRTATT